MTNMRVRSLMALMLPSACTAAPQEQSLLLVHGPAEAVGPTPAWCYSTLAEPDRVTQRNPAARDRLIGAYVPVEPSAEPAPISSKPPPLGRN